MVVHIRNRIAPPLDGSLTIPETIDFNRQHNPHAPLFVYASPDNSDAPSILTHLEFGRAADRVTHNLRRGQLGTRREVIAIIALSDTILYHAVIVGIMRAGFIPFPMSPRNTAAAIIKLMRASSCHRLLATQETLKSLIQEISRQLFVTDPDYGLSIEEMPSLDVVYPRLGHETTEDRFELYATEARFPLDETLLYLHSSGSTGLPKAIRHTFRSLALWAAFPPITELRDHPSPQVMATHVIPPFHALSIFCQLLVPLYGLVPIGVYPPTARTSKTQPMIPSPQNIIEHTRKSLCTTLLIIPALLNQWSQDTQVVEYLASLDNVVFGGGPVPSKIGNLLVEAGVYLSPLYGATEFGTPIHLFRGRGADMDWEYMKMSDRAKIRWISQGDGTFEAQFLNCDTHRVVVENLSDVSGYSSSDLFVPHPTKSGLWKVVGRGDDVIVHASGEKTVPAPMEDIMMSSPYFSGAVMFGREREQAGVLLELKPEYAIDATDEWQVVQARNLVWPIMEEANKICPAFSRIFKELILFVSKDKPLPRAGKGTVMRKAALNVYQEEIDDIYAKVQAIAKVDTVSPPASWNDNDVQAWLVAQVTDIQSTQSGSKPISIFDDLFEQGLDSLSAAILRRRIVGSLRASSLTNSLTSKRALEAAQKITQSTIYGNATIEKLTLFLLKTLKDKDDPEVKKDDLLEAKIEAIERMIEKYSMEPSSVVLITGTTGNLGAQLLEEILKRGNVQRVYTLNRSSGHHNIKHRHAKRFKEKGLSLELLNDPRIVYLEGDVTKRQLNQEDYVYNELLQHVNLIIHNAWRLDFNLALSSFESLIQGTQNLVDFARSCRQASSLKFLFTSSIGSASSWDKTKGKYPEEIVLDVRNAVGNGYGESKYIAERLLSRSGLNTTSFRIGQITGPQPSGTWAITDWVPILVQSSVTLGALPSCAGVVSWLPVDAVAQAMLDVAFDGRKTTSNLALNLVHPRPVLWDTVFHGISLSLVREGIVEQELPVIEFQEWLKLLEDRCAGDDIALENLPAAKLLDFFKEFAQADTGMRERNEHSTEAGHLPEFSTDRIQGLSSTMHLLPSLTSEDAAAWVGYWRRTGLFNSLSE